jgi:hypothetical protein
MSGIRLLRAGIAVLCVSIIMDAGVIVGVARWPLAVRAMAMGITALCSLTGFGLVALGARKVIIRAQEIRRRAAAAGYARPPQDPERA